MHRNDVWVYLLSGEIGVLVGDDNIATARAGDLAQASRRPARHVELGDKLARIVEVLTPGGTEAWFEELAGLEPGESDGFERACQRYGIEFLRDSPCTPTLRDRLGLE